MALNTIELTAQVIADLYSGSLVGTGAVNEDNPAKLTPGNGEKMSAVAEPGTAAWKSLGNNTRNILILIKNEELRFLPDNELTFLTGILGACKLSLEDVALVNLYHYPGTTSKELNQFFNSRIVLLFDIEPATLSLPVNFPHYQLQPFAGTTYLYAPSLHRLENDKLEKSKLWICLKRLFNL